jgi:formylglycine-generating enzyme required for sulfatase activity
MVEPTGFNAAAASLLGFCALALASGCGGTPNTGPAHPVEVTGCFMDRHEVTVAAYTRCVQEGGCPQPAWLGTQAATQNPTAAEYYYQCNFGRDDRANMPMNCVTWSEADAYCAWAGKRLPSESEWEYAARSGGLPQRYPWGNDPATCARSVMDGGNGVGVACGANLTREVCSTEAGNTQHSLCDMSGNVWEWVADDYLPSYYNHPADGSAVKNAGANAKVIRGGGYRSEVGDLHGLVRKGFAVNAFDIDIGFRCAY